MKRKVAKALCGFIPIKKYRKAARTCLTMALDRGDFIRRIKQHMHSDTVFVIGDSHTDIFNKNKFSEKKQIYGIDEYRSILACVGNAPNFITFHLGPCLAYTSNFKKSTYQTYRKTQFLIKSGALPKGCRVLCSFGEIDCRVHVKKQSERQQKSVLEVIDGILDHYLMYLMMIKKHGYRVIACGPVPSQSDDVPGDDRFPKYGTEMERNEVTRLFGDMLQKRCVQNDIEFIGLFEAFIGGAHRAKKGIFRDAVHLNTDQYSVIEKLVLG